MIALTPVAIARVKSILAGQKENDALRVAVVGGDCSGYHYEMTLDKEPRKDDSVMDMDGLKVFVDAQSMRCLEGTKVDYVESPEASGFQFDNPNVRASCACGESFDC